MKKFFDKFYDLYYRKRLRKWAVVNIKFCVRKIKRFFRSDKFKGFIKSVPFITGCAAALCVCVISTLTALFTKYACPFFDGDRRIISRLTMTEFDDSVPYLKSLYALGSSNRIQVTLKTDDENYINPRGVGLDRGGVNLKLAFSDGNTAEFALNNSNYDNFESGMTDTFTVILPFGYTPFDVTEYTIAVIPDINNSYDSWHCRWARVYFLLGNEPVMLARESWESSAVFGGGDNEVKQSALEIVHGDNNKYNRTKQIYSYYLELAQKGAQTLVGGDLKADALDSLGLNGGKFLYLDIETVNIEMQNNILTYYTKGVDIAETDSLDYDGRMYLDVTFFSEKPGGGYTESYLLDTLGTDDFELGTTSSFKLEMPEGMCVFDISCMSLRTENPYDAWAPHYVRAYIKPDYCDMLEIARLNDTLLINGYATPVFYKNLIDSGVELDLSSKFSVSKAVKKKIESENEFKFGDKISDMYFKLQSFYDRQNKFYEQAVSIYSQSVYDAPEPEPQPETEDDDTAQPDVDDGTNSLTGEKVPETDTSQPENNPAEDTPPEEPEGEEKQTASNGEISGGAEQETPAPEKTDPVKQESDAKEPSPENAAPEKTEPVKQESDAKEPSPENSGDTAPNEEIPQQGEEDISHSGGVWTPSEKQQIQKAPEHQIWNTGENKEKE